MDLEAVHAVLGLDVDHLAAGLAQHALDRRRDHPMAVRIPEDHHAAADVRVRDEVAGVEPTAGAGGPLIAQLSNLPCSDADHRVAGYSLRDECPRVISFASTSCVPCIDRSAPERAGA